MNRKDIGFSIFGIIFIISALSKAMNMPAFMALTREFMSLVGLGYMLPYSMPVAVAVCSSEITLGIMMFGRFKKIALIGILLMLTGFTWLTWVNLTDMYRVLWMLRRADTFLTSRQFREKHRAHHRISCAAFLRIFLSKD